MSSCLILQLETNPTDRNFKKHILAQFSNESEEGRNGDASWPLWGLSMRLIQAVSLMASKIYLILGMVLMLIATVSTRWVFIGMVQDGILTQIL